MGIELSKTGCPIAWRKSCVGKKYEEMKTRDREMRRPFLAVFIHDSKVSFKAKSAPVSYWSLVINQ